MKPVKVVLFHLAKFKEVHACCLNKTLRQLDQKSLINLEDINLLLGLSLINRSTVKSPFVVSKMTDIFCFLLIKIKQLYIKASQKIFADFGAALFLTYSLCQKCAKVILTAVNGSLTR